MAGSHHTMRPPTSIFDVGGRALQTIFAKRRTAEADMRRALYVRPAGAGYHEVKNVCNDQTYIVGDGGGGGTHAPGSVVAVGSFTGHPGEFVLSKAPAGFRGASRSPVTAATRPYAPTLPEITPDPLDPDTIAIALYWASGTLYSFNLFDLQDGLIGARYTATLATSGADEAAELRSSVIRHSVPEVAWLSRADERLVVWNLLTGTVSTVADPDPANLQFNKTTAGAPQRVGPIWVSDRYYWVTMGWNTVASQNELYFRDSQGNTIATKTTALGNQWLVQFSYEGMSYGTAAAAVKFITYAGVEDNIVTGSNSLTEPKCCYQSTVPLSLFASLFTNSDGRLYSGFCDGFTNSQTQRSTSGSSVGHGLSRYSDARAAAAGATMVYGFNSGATHVFWSLVSGSWSSSTGFGTQVPIGGVDVDPHFVHYL